MGPIASDDRVMSRMPEPHSLESRRPITAVSSLFGESNGLFEACWLLLLFEAGSLKVAKTGNDCPRLVGLLLFFGVGIDTGPEVAVDSVRACVKVRRFALPPKLEPRMGGEHPPSP